MTPHEPVTTTAHLWRHMPAGIWALGFVSLLMDVSSEMIHALLPVYLVVGLGTTALTVGVIEGIAEATAAITKVFSGALSDRIGRRKELAAIGYGLAALTKPIFPLAPSIGWLVAARFIDRWGKGIRGAPRDALVADIAPPDLRGAAFGLRQSLDTVGAFLGPLLAVGLMWAYSDDFAAVFWVAVIPAFMSFGLILFAVREPARPADLRHVRNPLARRELALLGPAYLVGGRRGFGVHAGPVQRGLPDPACPRAGPVTDVRAAGAGRSEHCLCPVGLSCGRPFGSNEPDHLADRRAFAVDRGGSGSGPCTGLSGVLGGVVLWGLHMGFTQGLLATLVADAAPLELRGTAFGMFNLATGIALLAASVLAGALWDVLGRKEPFLPEQALPVSP